MFVVELQPVGKIIVSVSNFLRIPYKYNLVK